MGIRITGISRVLSMLNAASKNLPQKIKAQRRISARKILSGAIKNAPKDTGKLRNTGTIDETDTTSEIKFSADYAPFMEFGTGGKVEIPAGFEELAKQFKGKGKRKVNIKAQPFLIPAFLKESINFKEECQKIIQQNK